MPLTKEEKQHLEKLDQLTKRNGFEAFAGIQGRDGYLKFDDSIMAYKGTIVTNEKGSEEYWQAIKEKFLNENSQVLRDFIAHPSLFDVKKLKFSSEELKSAQTVVVTFIMKNPGFNYDSPKALEKLSSIFPEIKESIMNASQDYAVRVGKKL